MKPICITLTAFGAYKNKEIIDFTELQGNHLFVISGATGAGKTTIFDGICFALYGSASGSDRANSTMLRSHFADDHIHTSVDFQFEIKGQRFRVFRQLAHKKEGNKSKTGDKNELYIETEKGEIPFVDRQIASEVNVKIEELIGLTEDQFKQIVMLPQGEFRKLLTSETENKEAILRRLFKTERYRLMHQLLKDKIDVINEEFSSEKQRLNHLIESIQNSIEYRENAPIFNVLQQDYHHTSQIVAALKEEKAYLDEKIVTNKKLYEEKKAASEHHQEKYHQGLALNERFTLLENQQQEMELLEGEAEKYARLATQLKNAEKANLLMPYEANVQERKNEWNLFVHKVEEGEVLLQKKLTELLSAKELYQQLANKEEERTERIAKIQRYEEFLPIVKDANQTKENLSNQSVQLNKMHHQLGIMENKRLEKVRERTRLKDMIGKQEKEIEPLQEKQIEILTLREQYKIMKDYMDAQQQTIKSKQVLREAEQMYQKIASTYKEKEAIWLDNQALVLAGHLMEGEACPVCGSTHHPEKAKANEQEVSREQLDLLKDKVEKQLDALNHARSHYQSNKNDELKATDQLTKYEIQQKVTERDLEDILEKGKKLGNEINNMEKVKTELQQLKQSLEKLEIAYEKDQDEKQKLEKNYHETELAFSSMKAAFTEKMRNIPKELQNLEQLQSLLKELKQVAEMDEQQWQKAQKDLKTKEEAYTNVRATLKSEKRQLDSVKNAVQRAQLTFQEKMREAGFTSNESYLNAKMPASEQKKVSDELNLYKEKKATLTQQLRELENELKNKEKVDVASLKALLEDGKKAYETALTTWNQSKSQSKLVEYFMTQIKSSEQRKMSLEKELAAMKDVYDTVRGQNEKKISFERYLQIDYLDQIILAANGRFKQLTNGQFSLERSDRQEAYGKQSGLAIDVFDGYTGQTRDVKTLSGGEKFIASLCLALGMSDVIQSYQGSISIETMFIDEGFGSLDEESLHKSIDALIQIQQSGRMIGVISHVEELKSLFPAMLKVTKTKEGHSRAAFVLK